MTIALRRSWAKDLDAATLYELFKRPVEGFVVDQSISYPGLDRRDLLAETRHFWLEGPDVRSWLYMIAMLEPEEVVARDHLRHPSAGSARINCRRH
jgi:predicted GNAT family N-acyltransferase